MKNINADIQLLNEMIRIRRFEEKCAELYSNGKIRGFLHLYVGEEAIAVGTIPLLRRQDRIVATYREHGHALVRGLSARSLMAEMYGMQQGCSRGRGGSMHLFDTEKNFFGGNAIVAGGIPMAVGLALSAKLQKQDSITACFFGDGAIAEGAFHESANLASLWKLPVLFLCENNFYAMGTPLQEHQAMPNLSEKAKGYRIAAMSVDGMDVKKVQEAMKEALKYIATERQPFFIEFQTYRFRAHSMYDPDLYRSKNEIAEWKKRDPIENLASFLKVENILSPTDRQKMEDNIAAEIEDAVAFAESGTREPIEQLTKDVYASEFPK